MERIKSLNWYQKGVLLLIISMVFVFSVIYPKTIARRGFEYKKAILIPNQENGSVVYSGKIQGKQARFTVFADKTVEFQYGDHTYGPYIAREDETAKPKGTEFGWSMTGVELRCGKEILFRGGVPDHGGDRWLYNEDGSLEIPDVVIGASQEIQVDENGNVIDPMAPSVFTILDLMGTPKLTHKGDFNAWLCGVFICIVTAISILFADELFRWNLAFQIRNADRAEPSDWEIAGRYISWTLLPLAAIIVFIGGLQ